MVPSMMHGQDSLDLFDIGVLLQALANNLKVGILAVHSGTRTKCLHIDRNRIEAIYTRKPRVSLQKVLYNHRSADKATLKAALDAIEADPSRGPLDAYLVSQNLVHPKRVQAARLYQTLEEILELFYWKQVGFEFYPADKLDRFDTTGYERLGEPVDIDKALIRCTRIIDDVAKFNEVTPSLRDVYCLQVSSLEELERLVPDPAQREFMLLLDGVRDMREVLRDMRMNRFEVLEFFYRFRKRGLIEPKNAFELLMLAENRRGEFTLGKRARVLERVYELGVEGFNVLQPLAGTYEEMGNVKRASHYYVLHAKQCVRDGSEHEALRALAKATSLTPEDPRLRELEIDLLTRVGRTSETCAAHRALAVLLRTRGDQAGAVATMRKAVRIDPFDPENWWQFSEALEAAGRLRPAAARSRRAGDILVGLGHLPRAEDAYRRALRLYPKAWSPRYRLVELLHSAGRKDAAVQELGDLVEFVDRQLHHLPVALRVRQLDRIEHCLRDCGGLVSSASGSLGHAYVRVDQPERAKAIFHESGDALAAARRTRSAAEMYAEYIELDVEDTDVRRKLSRQHVAMGDRDRALGQLRRVGSQHMASGNYRAARAVFEDMLSVDAACLDAHVGLAKALLYLEEKELASVHFHSVGLLHRGCGRSEQAIPYLREAVEKNPTDAPVLAEYCELLLHSGRKQEAISALSALVELRMRNGDPARAAIALRKILDIDERYPGAKEILRDAAKLFLRIAHESEEISADDAIEIVQAARAAADAD